MQENHEVDISALINNVAARIPLVDKSDLCVLTEILSGLSEIGQCETLCNHIKNIAQRAAVLAEQIILEEVSFESGIKRLNDAICKIQKEIHKLSDNNEDNTDRKDEYENVDPSRVAVLEDALDFVHKFISTQYSVLEELEERALNLESGDISELAPLKRILHTMKGEYGVLDLQVYSVLIHDVEDAIEKGNFFAENFFRLKDLLCKKLEQYADKSFPTITEVERNFIFLNTGKIKEESPRTKANDKRKTDNGVSTGTNSVINADPSLTGDFITESRDHISLAESLLLELEVSPNNIEHINSIFRSCHTIKGVAGFLGLLDIGTLAHAMENLMDSARKGEILLNAGHIDLLLEAMDCLKEFLTILESANERSESLHAPPGYSQILGKLKSATLIVPSQGKNCDESKKRIGEILVQNKVVSDQDVLGALKRQQDGDTRKIGEILIDDSSVSARAVAEALATQNAAKSSKIVEDTIRVPISRLDQLIDAIGEAVIAQSMITADQVVKNSTSQSLQTKLSQANLIMRQIQELSMSLRMVSIKSTFQKMARLVRDLSKKSGKKVDFFMDGEDTEIDKSVVENIGDPLIHMIRNSMDHGIEMPQERIEKNKSEIAKITLRAYHKAGNVFIEISDDGRGLNRDGILNKAIERGLCKGDEKMSDQEIFQFIFMPGFSTAKEVTDISGRGVGMDVVKKNVEALRGSVEIHTELHVGTTFTIRLPLTLAIIDGMIVRAGKNYYIVPTLSIVETIAAKDDIVESVLGEGEMIKVRGNLLPLLYLSQIFGMEKSGGSQPVALIVEDTLGKKAGILVDEIIGQQQVVIKNIGSGLINVQGISGGAIMSDGTVSLILDISGILKSAYDIKHKEVA